MKKVTLNDLREYVIKCQAFSIVKNMEVENSLAHAKIR